jgi:hypothetical protein
MYNDSTSWYFTAYSEQRCNVNPSCVVSCTDISGLVYIYDPSFYSKLVNNTQMPISSSSYRYTSFVFTMLFPVLILVV